VIKQPVFEEELVSGMDRELRSMATEQDASNLMQAADYLYSSMDLLEETGFSVQAEEIFQVLDKIAKKHQVPSKPNHYMAGLTPEKMVKNLREHGWVFNLADDGSADDLSNVEVGERLEVTEKDAEELDFEDEI
jgi:hypothetical protein